MSPLRKPSLWDSLLTCSPTRRARRQHRRDVPSVAALFETLESRVMLSAVGDLLFSIEPARSLAGIGQVSGADIVRYDLASPDGAPQYEVFFDGDDVGLGGVAIDAFARLNETELLLSFASNTTINGIGLVQMSDVVRFTAETLGPDTAGSFSLYLDGPSVGLDVSTSRHRNIDALSVLENGHLLISIEGSTTINVNGDSLAVREADVLEFAPTSDGPITGGSWSTFLRGSDVELTVATEDIDGVHVTADGRLFVSTVGSFFVNRHDGGGSFGGSNNDVLEILPDVGSGPGFGFPIFFDATVRDPALTGANVNAFELLLEDKSNSNTAPVAHAQDVHVAEDHLLSLALSGDDGEADVEQLLTYVIVDGPQHGSLTGFDPSTGAVSYRPHADYNGVDTFTFLVEDDASIDGTPLRSETVTVRISVVAVNDAPYVNGPGRAQVGNTNQPLSILGIVVGDIDAAESDGHLSVKLKVRAGTLSVNSHVGVEVSGNGSKIVVLKGTREALNLALAEGVTYLGRSGFSGRDRLRVVVNDLGNTGTGGPRRSSICVAIHVRSAAEQIHALKKTLDSFVDSHVLDASSARALQSKLKNIDPNSPSAKNKLDAFLHQVDALVRSRRLESAAADELRDFVTSIVISLPERIPRGRRC